MAPSSGADRTIYGAFIDTQLAYLKDAGWKQVGTDGRNLPTFSDPTVSERKSRVDKRVLQELDRSGEQIVVQQLVTPITDWDYRMEDAVAIQQDRDRIKSEAEQE